MAQSPRRYLTSGPQAAPNHLYGRHLVAAVQAAGAPYVLDLPDHEAAKTLARAITRCRLRKHWGPPGTFDPTPADPRGVGVGMYDGVKVSVKGAQVVLTYDPGPGAISGPISGRNEEPELQTEKARSRAFGSIWKWFGGGE